ncbi:MAG: aminotransferase class V-fold PLP-dependent enzyme, partial [Pirellulales bacterium]
IYGPPVERKGAIVSFTISGISAEDLAWRLDRDGVFTRHGHHCTMPLHAWLGINATTRASFGLYNTMEDVIALEEALQMAVHDLGSP